MSNKRMVAVEPVSATPWSVKWLRQSLLRAMAQYDMALPDFARELKPYIARDGEWAGLSMSYVYARSASEESMAFRAELGKILGPIKVLYVGSGTTGSFVRCLAASNDSNVRCVSIDKNEDTKLIPNTESHIHIRQYWETVMCEDLIEHAGAFDVMVLDVEPHGHEKKIYDKFAPAMRPGVHLVVASCIGRYETGGSYDGETFLGDLDQASILHDYLAIGCLDFRDVCAIVGPDAGLETHINSTLLDGLLGTPAGGTYIKPCMSDDKKKYWEPMRARLRETLGLHDAGTVRCWEKRLRTMDGEEGGAPWTVAWINLSLAQAQATCDLTLPDFAREMKPYRAKYGDEAAFNFSGTLSSSKSEKTVAFRVALGEILSPTKVLYVGSGNEGEFVRCMAASKDSHVECVSIDKDATWNKLILIPNTEAHTHIEKDWEDVTCEELGVHGTFDVMVIDGPGRKGEVYDKFASMMRQGAHLVVVSFNSPGSFDAEIFLNIKLFLEGLEYGLLYGYHVVGSHDVRDVWAIVDKDARPIECARVSVWE